VEIAGAGDGGEYRVDWADGSSVWRGDHRPEDVAAAFERGESTVGVAVIAFALSHPDPGHILPLVARAMESPDPQMRAQGVVAMAHTARLHRAVDRRCLVLLRDCRRGNAADDDLWSFIAHRKLPPWLWRHHAKERLLWWLRDRWRL
jgi:hypothetical protein